MQTAGVLRAPRDMAPDAGRLSARLLAVRAAVPGARAAHRSALVFACALIGIFGALWPWAEASVGSSIRLQAARASGPALISADADSTALPSPDDPRPTSPDDDLAILRDWLNHLFLRPATPFDPVAHLRPVRRRALVPPILGAGGPAGLGAFFTVSACRLILCSLSRSDSCSSIVVTRASANA